MTRSIHDVIIAYYKFRGLEMPNESQAFQFFVSEVGELADALVSSAGNWVRNNHDRERDIEGEAADVLMMLYVSLMERDIDPYEAMLKKFKQKGFTDGPAQSVPARFRTHVFSSGGRRSRHAIYARSNSVGRRVHRRSNSGDRGAASSETDRET